MPENPTSRKASGKKWEYCIQEKKIYGIMSQKALSTNKPDRVSNIKFHINKGETHIAEILVF